MCPSGSRIDRKSSIVIFGNVPVSFKGHISFQAYLDTVLATLLDGDLVIFFVILSS